MRWRMPVAAMAALALSGIPSAVAAPTAPACQVATDAPFDESVYGGPDGTPELDIVSASLTTSDSALSAVIEVRSLNPESGRGTGRLYALYVSTRTARWRIAADLAIDSDAYDLTLVSRLATADPGPGDQASADQGRRIAYVTGAVDPHRHTVRINVPRSLFAPYGGLGDALTDVDVQTHRAASFENSYSAGGVTLRSGFVGLPVDEATGSAAYDVRRRGCA